jgi:HD-GYP domain-containing protein (c-di-GMP phosphodiesterase class II)
MPHFQADIDQWLESYDYDRDPVLKSYFYPIAEELWSEITSYGEQSNDYGSVLSNHLQRTSAMANMFLVEELGFSNKAGRNFFQANLFQDLGKVHPAYDEEIWDLPYRPTEEERKEKRKHSRRGNEMIDIALAEAPAPLQNHIHIQVIKSIQRYHHERVDGQGDFGKTGEQLGRAMKAICIIDAYDGDMIYRPHQPSRRTPEETFDRLLHADKYQGAFDPHILQRFIDFQRRHG